MSDPSRTETSVVAKLFGAMVMAIGGLIAVLSGLCSLTVVWSMIQNAMRYPRFAGANLASLWLVLIFGGAPLIIGVGIFLWGLRLYRGR